MTRGETIPSGLWAAFDIESVRPPIHGDGRNKIPRGEAFWEGCFGWMPEEAE